MRQLIWSAALVPVLLMGCAQTQQAADTTVAAAKAQVNPTLSTSDAELHHRGRPAAAWRRSAWPNWRCATASPRR